MENNIYFYRDHDTMTEIKTMKAMVTNIPKDINVIVSYVQNILFHQHWTEAYGVRLSEERKTEPFIRSFEDKLIFLNSLGCTHVSEERESENKIIGICRDFSVAAVALCREAGIPARARCGFATYFGQGTYMDHWVLEYWNQNKKQWIMVDAQMDELQRQALNLSFDPFNVPEDYFITGPRAWKLCREGLADPQLFGIFKWWGYDYLRCNLILDANSLLKLPMQPWDMWEGYKSKPIEEWTEKDYKVMDKLSDLALKVDSDYKALWNFVHGDEKIKVPEDLGRVINSLE